MRAALLESAGAPATMIDDLEVAGPGPGQVTVDVEWCGLCHSDLSLMTGVHPAPLPIVLGHEASGRVAEVGAGVSRLSVGDPVVLTPVPPCGACYWCVRDQAAHCVNSVSLMTHTFVDGSTGLSRGDTTVYRGLGVGGFAQRVLTSETGAIRVPDDIPLEVAGVVGCAVQTGLGAVFNTARVRPGDTVAVLGLGGIGMSVVAGARIAGASRIIVSDPQSHRLDLASDFGATDFVDPTGEELVARVQAVTDNIGVDCAFEAVGSAVVVESAMATTRNGGTTVLVGAGPIEETINLSPTIFAVTGKRLLGCLLGGVNSLRDVPMILELHRTGRLDLEALVTARRPLEQLEEAAADMQAGAGLRTLLSI
ncbi:MAG: Zn-dependent alcohol dehydrogenase [Microthrixaceae bacterium]|nr:Zn-dependent alcohol dehydrogenase [Microthrixaceae bacterium]